MERIDRRRVLRLSGAGAVAGATGGLAGVLASGRAPAFAQGTTLHWVRGSDYVPVSDQMIRTKLNELAQNRKTGSGSRDFRTNLRGACGSFHTSAKIPPMAAPRITQRHNGRATPEGEL